MQALVRKVRSLQRRNTPAHEFVATELYNRLEQAPIKTGANSSHARFIDDRAGPVILFAHLVFVLVIRPATLAFDSRFVFGIQPAI